MTMVCGKHRITHCALCTWRDVNPAPRCGRTWCTDENPCLRCEKAKPQEGTPSARATQADQASGVPSCDSPELAAALWKRWHSGELARWDDVHALLRMVDDLRAKLAEAKEIAEQWRLQYDGAEAKLAESKQRCHVPGCVGPHAEVVDLGTQLRCLECVAVRHAPSELAAMVAADTAAPKDLATAGYGVVYEHRRTLLRMVDELTYQLAEERNATANDRDPSYHEERLKQENEALAKQLEAVCVRMSSELGEMQLKLTTVVTERDGLREKATELNLNIDGLNAEIHDLQEKLAESDTQLGWTEQKLEEEQKESQELAAKLADAERSIAGELREWRMKLEEIAAWAGIELPDQATVGALLGILLTEWSADKAKLAEAEKTIAQRNRDVEELESREQLRLDNDAEIWP